MRYLITVEFDTDNPQVPRDLAVLFKSFTNHEGDNVVVEEGIA